MKKKLTLKQISANFLLVCGMVSALCATVAQVKTTFFPEKRVTTNESATMEPTIYENAKGETPDDTQQQYQEQYVTMSAPESEESTDYTWIIILVVSIAAAGGGMILRKQIVKEAKEI